MMSRSHSQGTEVTIVTGAFSLAKHCSQACSAFDRILAKKTCQKCKRGKMEVIRMQIIFI